MGQTEQLLAKAKQGDVRAQNSLAIRYANEHNDQQAEYWWLKAATAGHVKAQANLGEFYYRKHKFTDALKWLTPASNAGDGNAIYRLALCYLNGYGVGQKDKEKARTLLNSAVERGSIAALNRLGLVEMEAGNQTLGLIFFKQAAEKGMAEAQYNVGYYYYSHQKIEEAQIWLQRAANQSYKSAIELLKRPEFSVSLPDSIG